MPHSINNPQTRPILPPQHHNDRVMLSTERSVTQRTREDRLPHDASVFVGSLPSNIDQNDLTRMLMDHLSEHTEIKNIKVVRDSKGGVCAFVQCENAASATRLIQTLHSTPPKPFLGRTLRYEPARAFRTLLVSYRSPTQPVRRPSLEKPTLSDMRVVEMELELAHAIRICKHKNSRFHSIVYNAEAVDADNADTLSNPTQSTSDHILFLNPLQFNKETLQNMASYFGQLESFSPFRPNKLDDHSLQVDINLPFPHNARRSPVMDPLCWEIKWEHRDDCVSALMTLRRIPHLTVTWAHQPSSGTGHVFAHRHFNPQAHFPLYQAMRLPHHPIHGPPQNRPKHIHVTPFQRQRFEPCTPMERPSKLECAETESAASATLTETPKLDRLKVSQQQTQTAVSDTPTTLVSATVHNTTTPGSDPASSKGSSDASQQNDAQELLYIPDTPSLDTSSITPITPGSQYPITPRTLEGAESPKDDFPQSGDVFIESSNHGRVTDPTTLFVGGLELFGPGAWTEEKLKSFFSRFGGLESVKIVRPMNSCAGFAFVKFNNVEAPARAVSEEHNRVHEGRTMRVQLRECNPARSVWRPGRGRGRLFHNPMSFQRRFMRPGFERPAPPPSKAHDKTSGFVADDFGGNHRSSPSMHSVPETTASSSAPMPEMGEILGGSSSESPEKEPETYREWYDELDSPTPAPSSLGSSASVAGVSMSGTGYQATYPNTSFYPSVPWAPPMLPGTYQVPYFGPYPPYNPHPPQNQRLITPPASDASGPSSTSRQSWPHPGLYTQPYVPYPVFPFRPATETTGHLHVNPQAPLVPTGFMQNEQGTLIAVYQPEALDQYLAAASGNSSQVPHVPHIINVPRFGVPSTLPVHHPVYETTTSAATCEPQNAPQQRSRNHANHAAYPFAQPPHLASLQRPPISFRGCDGALSTSAPLYRRQGAKTDFSASQQAQWNGPTTFVHPSRTHGPGGSNPSYYADTP